MSKATVFAVCMLTIAMVVGFGASAAAPVDDGYDPTFPPRDEETPPVDGGDPIEKIGGPIPLPVPGPDEPEENGHQPQFNPPLKYVESWGGIVCPCPEAPVPHGNGNGATNLR
jgi:hypothetical protein